MYGRANGAVTWAALWKANLKRIAILRIKLQPFF